MSFSICDNKGFHVTFPNGYTVSVQFGPGNYGSNHAETFSTSGNVPMSAELVETALLAPNGDFVAYKDADVQGYQTASDVLELFNYASKL